MAAGTTSISEWIAAQTQVDDAIAEYAAGFLSDETLDDEEKREAIFAVLSEGMPEAKSLPEGFMDTLFKMHAEELQRRQVDEEAERLQRLNLAREQEQATLAATVSEQEVTAATRQKRTLTREEQKERDLLLAKYGFAMPEVVEGADGEEVFVYGSEDKDTGSSSAAAPPAPRNADLVKNAEAEKRRLAAQSHAKNVEREKELLRKKELAKEKEKRRTQ
ncbi:hypothetical protein HDU93_002797, partial [Gonapodya sp. JEL0774]